MNAIKPIGAMYSAREQAVAMRDIQRERGKEWGRNLTRVEFNAILRDALSARYGER